jgi:hypothetical protein
MTNALAYYCKQLITAVKVLRKRPPTPPNFEKLLLSIIRPLHIDIEHKQNTTVQTPLPSSKHVS